MGLQGIELGFVEVVVEKREREVYNLELNRARDL